MRILQTITLATVRFSTSIFNAKMDNVKDVEIKPLEESIYLQPYTMHYIQNGKKKTWDLLQTHDSVAILIYHPKRDSLLFVKQFRPPVYYGSIQPEDRQNRIDVDKYPPELGITLELCAGIVDKNKPLVEIAREEILEECGYDVPIEKIEKIGSYRSGVGSIGSLQTGFYCEIDDTMKINDGGGVDDEIIEVVEMTIPEIKEYLKQDNIKSPPSFMFAIYWFLYHKSK